MDKCRAKIKNEEGQAMAEFVIVLFLIMIMLSGMLYMHRLLTMQFWAQQEARFLAFEQTWTSHSTYADAYEDPKDHLDNSDNFPRPSSIENVQNEVNREIEEDGEIGDLVLLDPKAPESRGSIWNQKSNLVNTAYAALTNTALAGKEERYESDMVYGIHKLIKRGSFGKRHCETLASLSAKKNYSKGEVTFSSQFCPDYYDIEFARHLSANVNFPDFFRSYGSMLDVNPETSQALIRTLETELQGQYYSFFDDRVRQEFNNGDDIIEDGFFDISTVLVDSNFLELRMDAKYFGSLEAMDTVATVINSISDENENNRNVDVEKAFEEDINDIIYVDADNGFNYLPNFIDYSILAVDFSPVFGNLYSAIMVNILDQESALVDDLIEESNKLVEVEYDPGQGLFPAITRRFETDKKVKSTFYMVTQPWHIPRRESATGAFMDVGDQYSESDDATEEGFLRKRVFGLFVFPSRPNEFLTVLTGMIPGGDGLDSALGVLSAADGAISFIKDLALGDDGPLDSIFDALQGLSGIAGANIDIALPNFPSVRPHAYPGTVEIENDNLARESPRTFDDFIQEQHDNDPAPKPKYH